MDVNERKCGYKESCGTDTEAKKSLRDAAPVIADPLVASSIERKWLVTMKPRY